MFIKLDLPHNILNEKLAIVLPEEWKAERLHLNIHAVYELPDNSKYYQECLYADNITVNNKVIEINFPIVIQEAELPELYEASAIKLFIELVESIVEHQCLIIGVNIKKQEEI